MNDEELIEKSLAGDKEAFGELVLRYQDRVYNLALPIVGNRQDAEDVVQETFVQALTHLSGFRKSSRFYTWLYRIAYNCAVGSLRRRRPKVSYEASVDKSGEKFASDVEAPDAGAIQADVVRVVRAALAKLPEEYRVPLVLREFEEASYEQIAEILDVPVGTVRSRLHRARAALHDELIRAGVTP